jgi:hypothetical protein
MKNCKMEISANQNIAVKEILEQAIVMAFSEIYKAAGIAQYIPPGKPVKPGSNVCLDIILVKMVKHNNTWEIEIGVEGKEI